MKNDKNSITRDIPDKNISKIKERLLLVIDKRKLE